MEIKIFVLAEILAAIKLFAANEGVGSRLDGVNLEIGAAEFRLAATDGCTMGCYRVLSEQSGVTASLNNIIIPNDLLKHIKPRGMVEITIGQLEGPGLTHAVTVTYAGMSASGKTIDAMFPDVRRMAATLKVSGLAAQFNPAYIGRFAKAAALIRRRTSAPIGIGFNGDGPALVDIGDDNFFGLLAPRAKGAMAVPEVPPKWVAARL